MTPATVLAAATRPLRRAAGWALCRLLEPVDAKLCALQQKATGWVEGDE
jgi:hypothetical protein